jgi:hypothetical protein
MDKARFLQIAHMYYALAIISHFREESDAVPLESIVGNCYVIDHETGSRTFLLVNSKLLDAAVRLLVAKEVVEVIHDDFGPSLFAPMPDFRANVAALRQDRLTPFYRAGLAGFSKDWITEALQNLARSEKELGITDEDFDKPGSEWQPIPLDRSEPELQATINAVDAVVEAVRADNGYAATLPEERSYVLDGLAVLTKRLKDATTISAPFIRAYGIDPITRLARRFGGTAIELLVAAAKEALKEWLKKRGIGFLDGL